MDPQSALKSPFFIQCTYFINLGFILLRFYYCDELCNFSSQKCESKIAIRMLFDDRYRLINVFHIKPAYEKRHHEDKKNVRSSSTTKVLGGN